MSAPSGTQPHPTPGSKTPVISPQPYLEHRAVLHLVVCTPVPVSFNPKHSLPDILLPEDQCLDMFDSESDISGDNSEDELVEVL